MISLTLSDWQYNAGVVGLLNVLSYGESEAIVDKKSNLVVLDPSFLEKFEKDYFQYFSDKYEIYTSWHKIVSSVKDFQTFLPTEEFIEKWNAYVEYTKSKLTSNSFQNTYPLVEGIKEPIAAAVSSLKKITKKKKESYEDIYPVFQEQLQTMQDIISILRRKEVKTVLLARNVGYDVIRHFWEGVSFLHKQANKKNMFDEYRKSFIEPLQAFLKEKQDEEWRKTWKHQCFACGDKIPSLSRSSKMSWIRKTGVDSDKKSSHFWNHISDAYICPMCSLVYSCVPAGFTFWKGKGLFVNENSSVNTILSVNQLVLQKGGIKSFDELEEKGYFKILDTLEQTHVAHAQKEIQNIQFVKYDDAHPYLKYTFQLLSKEKLKLIQQNKKHLAYLIGKFAKDGKEYISIYQETMKRLYRNQEQFDFIYYLFKLSVSGSSTYYFSIRNLLYINNGQLKKGGGHVYYKEIEKFQQYGVSLRKSYKGMENKLPGITHRLLNALKVKNEPRFMDTLINSYMYKGRQIPLDFIEGLKDEKRFQTLGYAFLLGLQGEQTAAKETEETVDEK